MSQTATIMSVSNINTYMLAISTQEWPLRRKELLYLELSHIPLQNNLLKTIMMKL